LIPGSSKQLCKRRFGASGNVERWQWNNTPDLWQHAKKKKPPPVQGYLSGGSVASRRHKYTVHNMGVQTTPMCTYQPCSKPARVLYRRVVGRESMGKASQALTYESLQVHGRLPQLCVVCGILYFPRPPKYISLRSLKRTLAGTGTLVALLRSQQRGSTGMVNFELGHFSEIHAPCIIIFFSRNAKIGKDSNLMSVSHERGSLRYPVSCIPPQTGI